MPFNGSGTFVRLRSWVTDQANGLLVRADLMDSDTNDIAAGLSACVTKDGQSGALTNNLQMGSFKITGLGNGSASTDAVNYGQVFTNPAFTGNGSISGTWTVGGALTASAGGTFTGGTFNFTGATTTVATPTTSTQAANKGYVDGVAFSAALPSQTGNAGKYVTTDGTTASWGSLPVSGFVNRFVNGNFSVDQRNNGSAQTITAAAALAYTVDRWYAYSTGANVTGQRVAGTAPDQYLYQFTGAASVTKIGFAQRIEAANIQDLASTTVTLSAYMSNSLLTTVTWVAYYANTADAFGTLASPTRTQIATGTFTVSSTLTRYSTNISLPANAANGVEIEFSVAAQTSGTWKIGRVQLEPGSSATTFEQRTIGVESLLCLRYLPVLPPFATGLIYANNNVKYVIPLPVMARTTPTGLTATSTGSIIENGTTVAANSLNFESGGITSCIVNHAYTPSTLTVGQAAIASTIAGYFTGCEL